MSAETQKVDVLEVMNDVVIDTERSPIFYDDLRSARAAVAELIEAVRENRAATEIFAADGCPANYVRYDESERRLLAALDRVGGAS